MILSVWQAVTSLRAPVPARDAGAGRVGPVLAHRGL